MDMLPRSLADGSEAYLPVSGGAMYNQDSLRLAMEYASKVAAYTVSQVGANPPWRQEIT